MLPDSLFPRVEFEFEGEAYPLLFTHRVLLQCEHETGVDMLGSNLSDPSAALIRALLFFALDRAGAACTMEQVGALIRPRTLPAIRSVILRAWAASMQAPEPAAKTPPREYRKTTWPDAWASATSRDGLNLAQEEWLDMIPRQVGELNKLRLEQMQREELIIGILASAVSNSGFCRPVKPRTAESYMIHPLPELPEEPLTGEYIMQQIKAARGN